MLVYQRASSLSSLLNILKGTLRQVCIRNFGQSVEIGAPIGAPLQLAAEHFVGRLHEPNRKSCCTLQKSTRPPPSACTWHTNHSDLGTSKSSNCENVVFCSEGSQSGLPRKPQAPVTRGAQSPSFAAAWTWRQNATKCYTKCM